jgi:hypothetical protein
MPRAASALALSPVAPADLDDDGAERVPDLPALFANWN